MVNHKKHILILTPGFPKDESDENCIPPLQIFLEDFKKTFDEYNVTVIAVHYPPNNSHYFWKKIEIYSCGGNDVPFPKRFKVWWDVFNYADEINRELSISCVHSFWLGECAFLGTRISKKYNVPHINTMMGQELNKNNYYLKFINLDKTKVAAVSERQALLFKTKTGKAVTKIIPWGISKEEKIVNKLKEYDIIGVGSLTPGKNFELFVEIVHDIKKVFPRVNAALVGDGTEKQKIKDLIINLNLENNLKLLGTLNREDVLNLMGKSRILLHTSKYESFGYVLAEALASGCYVVCSETGFAKNMNKMVVVNEKDEFIKKIIELMKSKLDFTPELPFTLNETSASYKKLYYESIVI